MVTRASSLMFFKADFVRRISIAQTERFDSDTGKTRLCRGTTYARLRVCEGIELAFFLDKIGLGGRLLFRNTRLSRTDKAVRLQLTTGQRAPDALSLIFVTEAQRHFDRRIA